MLCPLRGAAPCRPSRVPHLHGRARALPHVRLQVAAASERDGKGERKVKSKKTRLQLEIRRTLKKELKKELKAKNDKLEGLLELNKLLLQHLVSRETPGEPLQACCSPGSSIVIGCLV